MRFGSGDLKNVYSWLHGRKTCTFEVASGRGIERETSNDKPSVRPPCSLTWKVLLAGSPLSKSVVPRPLQSRAVLALLYRVNAIPRRSSGPTLHEARAPLGAGTWEPVLGAVASVSLEALLRTPIKNRCASPANLSRSGH